MISRRFWQGRSSTGSQAYSEVYQRLDGHEAVSIHTEHPAGGWSAVRLLRSDFEQLLSAYRRGVGRDRAD